MLPTWLMPRGRNIMEVGASFENFKQVENALEKLKKEQYHPLQVYNSQSAKDYNKKGWMLKTYPHLLILKRFTTLIIVYVAEVKVYVPIRGPSPKVVRQKWPWPTISELIFFTIHMMILNLRKKTNNFTCMQYILDLVIRDVYIVIDTFHLLHVDWQI